MRYLCLVYQDVKRLGTLSQHEYDALMAETLAYDEELRQSEHYIASDTLDPRLTATSIRVRDGRVSISDSPLVASPEQPEQAEQVGGYVLIEARDLNEAIRVASRIPAARLGGVEVRPVTEFKASS